jgi:hypothetical protein
MRDVLNFLDSRPEGAATPEIAGALWPDSPYRIQACHQVLRRHERAGRVCRAGRSGSQGAPVVWVLTAPRARAVPDVPAAEVREVTAPRLMMELVAWLPPEDTPFSASKRRRFVAAAEAVLDLLYEA